MNRFKYIYIYKSSNSAPLLQWLIIPIFVLLRRINYLNFLQCCSMRKDLLKWIGGSDSLWVLHNRLLKTSHQTSARCSAHTGQKSVQINFYLNRSLSVQERRKLIPVRFLVLGFLSWIQTAHKPPGSRPILLDKTRWTIRTLVFKQHSWLPTFNLSKDLFADYTSPTGLTEHCSHVLFWCLGETDSDLKPLQHTLGDFVCWLLYSDFPSSSAKPYR